MGNGSWSATTYHDRAADRAKNGADTFDYSDRARRSGTYRVHQTLDPRGLILRESRDSQEHPASNAIVISLDVTGSMGRVVRGIHADLPHLHELLLGHNYIADPQILFAAVGDATCDAVPLQIGQFESDNRMDQHLENMILEGGGGGQNRESYELMLYVAAHHTAIDCWEKRQKKGYFFMIGDEMAYPSVNHQQVNGLIGRELQSDVPLADVIREVMQKYHFYFIIPGGASHGSDQQITTFWTGLIGPDRVIRLERPEDTSECIALTIGVNEGAITVAQGVAHLQTRGIVGRTIESIGKALSALFPGAPTVHAPKKRKL